MFDQSLVFFDEPKLLTMKILCILNTLFLIFLNVLAKAQIAPTALRCEYLENPPVVDILNPRLSWVNVAR
jgi:alpha-L-rhamnosidase